MPQDCHKRSSPPHPDRAVRHAPARAARRTFDTPSVSAPSRNAGLSASACARRLADWRCAGEAGSRAAAGLAPPDTSAPGPAPGPACAARWGEPCAASSSRNASAWLSALLSCHSSFAHLRSRRAVRDELKVGSRVPTAPTRPPTRARRTPRPSAVAIGAAPSLCDELPIDEQRAEDASLHGDGGLRARANAAAFVGRRPATGDTLAGGAPRDRRSAVAACPRTGGVRPRRSVDGGVRTGARGDGPALALRSA